VARLGQRRLDVAPFCLLEQAMTGGELDAVALGFLAGETGFDSFPWRIRTERSLPGPGFLAGY
jgi:hypothetical protein